MPKSIEDDVVELVVARVGERDGGSAGRHVGVEEVVAGADAAVGRWDHGVVVALTHGQRHGDDVVDRRGAVEVGCQVDPDDVLAGVEGRDRVAGRPGVVEEEVGERPAFEEAGEAGP